MRTSNVLHGWREQEYGRSRGRAAAARPASARPRRSKGCSLPAQHGEEAETGLLARRLLERVPGDVDAVGGGPGREPGRPPQRHAPERGQRRPEPQLPLLPAGARARRSGPCRHRPRALRATAEPQQPLFPGAEPAIRAGDPGVDGARSRSFAPKLRARPARADRADPRPRRRPARARRASWPSRRDSASSRAPRGRALPGAFDEWLARAGGSPAIVYEVEHAGLPQLCLRHLPGLEALLRS